MSARRCALALCQRPNESIKFSHENRLDQITTCNEHLDFGRTNIYEFRDHLSTLFKYYQNNILNAMKEIQCAIKIIMIVINLKIALLKCIKIKTSKISMIETIMKVQYDHHHHY